MCQVDENLPSRAWSGSSGFADGRHEVSPDSEQILLAGTKYRKQNSVSVEQIQDSPAVDTIKQTMTFCYRLFYCSYGNDANPLNEVHSGSAQASRGMSNEVAKGETRLDGNVEFSAGV